MKKYNKLFIMALSASLSLGITGCRDDWSDMNTSEETLAKASPAELLTGAEYNFNPFGYDAVWFWNAAQYFTISQMSNFGGGINSDRLIGAIPGGVGCMTTVLRYVSACDYEMSQLSEEEVAKNEVYRQAIKTLSIYAGIIETDTSGDTPYTEGGRALHGGPLKPKYDRVEDLYPLWNDELKEAVRVFKNAPESVTGASESEIAYGGDWSKWAKFASSLRVKIATRLTFRNLELAKEMVSQAVADGVMTSAEDDMFYHKADPITGGDWAFGSGNTTIDYRGICGNKKVVDWMLKNRDPRLRFQYEKNEWTVKVLRYYLDNGFKKAVPPIVLDRAELDENGSFVKWKDEAGGDLWARYVGVPDVFDPTVGANGKDPELCQYFKYSRDYETEFGNRITVKINDNNEVFSYCPYSPMNEKIIRTNENFTLPRIPGDNALKADFETDYSRYDMYMSSAEVNFYLAEFAIYGTPGLGAAADYFKKAVEQSVEAWDKLASLSHVQYYHEDYAYADEHEAKIGLREGEIRDLLNKPDYQLTGNKADDLEKIFLNLEIHFNFNPVDHFVTARRSGVPKTGSSILPRTEYSSFPSNIMPRRPNFQNPSPTDQMVDILKEVYQRQGFTLDIKDPRTGELNNERLWQDVGAPNWGEGPKVL